MGTKGAGMKALLFLLMAMIALQTTLIAQPLTGKRAAVLITEGFHDEETQDPIDHLRDLGAEVTVIGPQTGTVEAYNSNHEVTIEKSVGEVSIDDFEGLIIPGGNSPGRMDDNNEVVAFVRNFFLTGKPVAAICHGPLLLVAADVVDGFEATGYQSIRDELEDAGADYKNQEVVVDRNMITSRKPDDIPAFIEKITQALSEQTHAQRLTGAAIAHNSMPVRLHENVMHISRPGAYELIITAANGGSLRRTFHVGQNASIVIDEGLAPGRYLVAISGHTAVLPMLVRR